MPGSELARRVAVAVIGIPVAVAAVHAGGWVLGGLLAVLAAGGALELYRLAGRQGVRPFTSLGAAAALGSVLLAAWRPAAGAAAGPLLGVAVALALVTAGAAVWARGVEGRPLAAVAVTVFGVVYSGWTLAHAVFLRHEFIAGAGDPRAGAPAFLGSDAWLGTAVVVFVVGLTWINDSCAYFAGRAWGRRKLIPRVSPGKTVVGAVAGVAGAVAFGAAYAWVVLAGWYGLAVGPLAGAAGGVLIAVVAQVGDLAESVLKREAGVKDSGRLIPGHGGILDRLDALFFTLPAAYWYLAVLLGRSGGVA